MEQNLAASPLIFNFVFEKIKKGRVWESTACIKRVARTHHPMVTLSQNGYGAYEPGYVCIHPVMTFLMVCECHCSLCHLRHRPQWA